MKKTALLFLLMLLALGILLSSCGKKDDEDKPPEDGTQGGSSQIDPEAGNVPEPSEPVELTVGTVLADAVNIRQSASSQSTSLGKVSRGDMLLIRGPAEGADSEWYPIEYNGQNGYIHKDFVVQETISSTANIEIATVVNIESVLNIRSAPNTESTRLGKAKLGDKFRVLERDAGSGWTKIQYQGTESSTTSGYVKTEYLRIEQKTLNDSLL